MERKIAIMTDTACDLEIAYCKENDIFMIPFTIYITNKTEDLEFKDKYEISNHEFLEYMRNGYSVQTATALLGDVMTTYDEIEEAGFTDVIVISTSSGLSGMYQNYVIGKEMHEGSINIHVVDSKSLSHVQGAYVSKARDLVMQGFGVEEVLLGIDEMHANSKIYFVPETLEYLIRGGRIGGISAVLGELLKIIPVGFVDANGKFAEYSKNRGIKRAMKSLTKAVDDYIDIAKHKVFVAQAEAGAHLQEYMDVLRRCKEERG